jgi:hypothetical protein
MITSDENVHGCPCVSTVLIVRDDETGWAHVAYDIDPRRRPRTAGFILCESEQALGTGMTTTGFRMASAYRVNSWSTAFLFERVAACLAPVPDPAGRHTECDGAGGVRSALRSRLLRLVR